VSGPSNLLIHKISDVTVVTFQDARLLESQKLEALGEELYRLVDQMDRKKLIVDCTKVQFLASAAISVFVNLQKKSTAIKGTLIICGMRKDLMQVFEITRLTKLFKFAADEKAALQVLGVTSAG
jgi:anti-sigma B factor antagonist